jgi:glycosyltransferase involved in cell wall biosynthesis
VHEALANGLSVITTDQVAAADDLVDHGVNRYVVPAGSAEGTPDAMRTDRHLPNATAATTTSSSSTSTSSQTPTPHA